MRAYLKVCSFGVAESVLSQVRFSGSRGDACLTESTLVQERMAPERTRPATMSMEYIRRSRRFIQPALSLHEAKRILLVDGLLICHARRERWEQKGENL